MSVLALAALHAGWLGTGIAIFGPRTGRQPHVFRECLEAYFAGAALHIIVLYAWSALAPVPVAAPRVLIAGGIVAGFLRTVLALRLRVADTAISSPLASVSGRAGATGLKVTTAISPVDLLLIVVVALPLALIFLSSWFVPISHWDPLAIWTAKAGFLFHGEYLGSEVFIDEGRVHPHKGYPIGYSLILFEHAAAAGRFDELLMNRGLLLFLVSGLALLASIMSEWTDRRTSLAALGLLLWTPAIFSFEFAGSASSGYADLPLGLCAALATGLLIRACAFEDSRSSIAGCGLIILVLAFKHEGLVWTILLCALGSAVVTLRGGWRHPKQWFTYAAPVIAAAALVLAHSRYETTSDVGFPSIDNVGALLNLVPHLSARSFELLAQQPIWGVLRFFLPVALLTGLYRSRRKPLALFGLAAPIYLVISIVVLGLTEVQLDNIEYYSQQMFPRLIIQLIPSALLYSVILNSAGFTNPLVEE